MRAAPAELRSCERLRIMSFFKKKMRAVNMRHSGALWCALVRSGALWGALGRSGALWGALERALSMGRSQRRRSSRAAFLFGFGFGLCLAAGALERSGTLLGALKRCRTL